LWEELSGVFGWWEVPWCIGGDFNVTRFPNNRVGVTRLTSAMLEFSDFISEHGLMDILLARGFFTWSNDQDPPTMLRIDRFLVPPDWEEHFPNLIQIPLPRPLSNHFSILLDSGGMSREDHTHLNLKTCGRKQSVL
jgi:hypothetical protein